MKLFKNFLLAFVPLFAVSCITHYFSQPLPVDAKEEFTMPKVIVGEWVGGEDTVYVEDLFWTINSTDSTGNRTSSIEFQMKNDSIVIKRWRNNYYFNTLESNGYWNLYLGHEHKNQFFLQRLAGEDTLTLNNAIGVVPDRIEKSNRFYDKSITKRQLRKFVRKGGFCDTVMVFDMKTRTILK